MKSRRLIQFVLFGVLLAGITVVGAAKYSGEKPPENGGGDSKAKANDKRTVVVFGTVDVEEGMQQLFPESFPNPVHVIEAPKKGAKVKKGDVLLKFDDVQIRLKVKEAEAGLAEAESQLPKAEGAVAQAKSALAQQKAQVEIAELNYSAKERELSAANADYSALSNLLRNSGEENRKLTDEDLMKKYGNLRALMDRWHAASFVLKGEKLKLENAKDDSGLQAILKQAEAEVNRAKANIEFRKVQVEQAKSHMRYSYLKAPMDGTVAQVNVAAGATIGAQTRIPPVLLLPEGKLIIRAEIEQDWISYVENGKSVQIADDTNEVKWSGRITYIDDILLPKRSLGNPAELFLNNETRVLNITIEVTPDSKAPPLRVNQRVKLTLGGEK